MGSAPACRDPEHRPYWRVDARRRNYSAFNGYRATPSDWSAFWCLAPVPGRGACLKHWRSKAAYVDQTPDITEQERRTMTAEPRPLGRDAPSRDARMAPRTVVH